MLWIARWRVRVSQGLARAGFDKDWFLIPLAAVIGVLGGFVAMGFGFLVDASTSFFFGRLGKQEFPGSHYILLILLPAAGGLAVGMVSRWLAHTKPGHGIPEVIESLARRRGEMAGRSGFFKAITASLTLGSGGSGGVEGPIIQIGSVLGSVVARSLRVGREHMHTLVGCGAAAGLASIFNAPIAGVLFVLEVLLRDFSLKTFMPIVIASVFGTATAQAVMGGHAAAAGQAIFHVPPDLHRYSFTVLEVVPYAVLGLGCGVAGVVFCRVMVLSETLWDRVKVLWWIKPALGGAMLGLLGVAFVFMFGRPVHGYEPPPFFGNGYRVIEALFNPHSYAQGGQPNDAVPFLDARLHILAAVLVLKMVGTALTLGSGGAGGVFAPSLFTGATLGAIVGVLVQMIGLWPVHDTTAPTYALVGMAGMIAAVVHCPLTAFILVFEITRDYQVILPTMLVAILATLCSQFIQRDSIYTLYLRRQGIRIGTLADMTLLRRVEITSVPLVPAVLVEPNDTAQHLIDLAGEYAAEDFVVVDAREKYVGMVVGDDVRTTLLQREAVPLLIVGELMRDDLPTVTRDETLEMVLDKFARHDVSSLVVVDANSTVKGLVTRARLMQRYQALLQSG